MLSTESTLDQRLSVFWDIVCGRWASKSTWAEAGRSGADQEHQRAGLIRSDAWRSADLADSVTRKAA